MSTSFAECHWTSPARCPRRRRCKAFLADPAADKRDQLVDALLETPEYSYLFTNHWATLLRVRTGKDHRVPLPRLLFTIGSATASPPTSLMTNSSAKFSRPTA